jgi:hypothetical protein
VAERSATIVAPGYGLQHYTIYQIDTREFTGGVLQIDIQIARDSATDGSFDLFPSDIPIPTRGDPIGTLVGRYNVPRGTSTHIEYKFKSGQVFAFGLEGNWDNPKGASGVVQFQARVRK